MELDTRLIAGATKKLFKGEWMTPPVIGAIGVAFLIVLGALGYMFRGTFIAATVNGIPISRLSIMLEAERQFGGAVLEGKITEKLIASELDAQRITVSDEEVSARLEELIKEIELSGGSLEQLLTVQGITVDEVRMQILLQERVKKLLGDSVAVTDEEVTAYIKDNKITPQNGETLETTRANIKEGLIQQKFNEEAGKWIESLKASAKINTFHTY